MSNPRRRDWIDWCVEIPSVIAMFLMMFHVSANALARYLFNDQLPYTLELVQYWYVPIIALLGFVAAQHRGQHISAEFLFDLLPAVTQKYVLALGTALGVIVCAGFAWYGLVEAIRVTSLGLTAGPSPVPFWPVYYISVAVFALFTMQLIFATVRALRGKESILTGEAEATREAESLLDGGTSNVS